MLWRQRRKRRLETTESLVKDDYNTCVATRTQLTTMMCENTQHKQLADNQSAKDAINVYWNDVYRVQQEEVLIQAKEKKQKEIMDLREKPRTLWERTEMR